MSAPGSACPNGCSRLWPSPAPNPSRVTAKHCTRSSCDIWFLPSRSDKRRPPGFELIGPSEEHEGMGSRSDAEIIACSVESPAVFGEVFDRHATTLFRYFVRRVGPDDADALLGELFRIAFERRETFDTERPEARPWLYGI